ncbi:Transcriptional regulator, TetR family [Labilithrix luteola]|uniref:Transcriptional regulator, TetR family n=1 Tax=Labilithrix luteola TaxID=1391654 RepID=A0A0K1PKQ9_9BACT|nr:TetR/AcrR family transcriptional regulator [Labilithrix luteola]AKU94110.1 Transcriptional regulator, TetR family [Labilithrix luteola]
MESILEAAAQVLETVGFEKMTTTKVALRAGTSVGSLYQYFPSKDALLYALLERKFARIVSKLATSIESSRGESLDVRTSALIEALFREKAARAKLGAELARQAPRLDKRRMAAHLAEEVHRLVHGMLEEHREELGVQDLELASWMLVHAVTGIADAAMLGALERLRDPAFIEAVTDHALGALGRKRRRARS